MTEIEQLRKELAERDARLKEISDREDANKKEIEMLNRVALENNMSTDELLKQGWLSAKIKKIKVDYPNIDPVSLKKHVDGLLEAKKIEDLNNSLKREKENSFIENIQALYNISLEDAKKNVESFYNEYKFNAWEKDAFFFKAYMEKNNMSFQEKVTSNNNQYGDINIPQNFNGIQNNPSANKSFSLEDLLDANGNFPANWSDAEVTAVKLAAIAKMDAGSSYNNPNHPDFNKTFVEIFAEKIDKQNKKEYNKRGNH